MATYLGKDGTLTLDAATVGELVSFSITDNIETVDDTAFGDTVRSFKPSLRNWSGELTAHFDDADAGQVKIEANVASGATTALVATSHTGATLTGNCIITGMTASNNLDGTAQISCTFQGNGALTHG